MKTKKVSKVKSDNQITGNVGLYFVCYKLSKLGWNVLPTSRNTKGIDLFIHKHVESNDVIKTIQIKTLSKRNAVPLGEKLDNLFADWFIICTGISPDINPECFILSKDEIKDKIDKNEKNGKTSYWLEPKNYEKFRENEKKWEEINN